MRIIAAGKLPPSFYSRPSTPSLGSVRRILTEVRQNGDRALRKYTRLFDRVDPPEWRAEWRVKEEVAMRALMCLEPGLRRALEQAARSIRTFASRQLRPFRDFEIETSPGVFCGQRVIPLERVGVYVPAGRYPLVSSLLMGAVPAQVAGVAQIAVCSPPGADGFPRPLILAAAALLGIKEIYGIGGVQAIAALAYGTPSVPRVDKIVGPGNRFVALAKREVLGEVGIDMVAGPSEVFIVADSSADPALAAADLLAQAEHDPEATAVLLTDSQAFASDVAREVAGQLPLLPTRRTAARALSANGWIVRTEGIAQAASICNRRAPEHLELQGRRVERNRHLFTQFGTLFIGAQAAEALGDYSSGLNHTLPTAGWARFASGLSVRDFFKLSTTLRLQKKKPCPAVETARVIALAEGLPGHARSLEMRH